MTADAVGPKFSKATKEGSQDLLVYIISLSALSTGTLQTRNQSQNVCKEHTCTSFLTIILCLPRHTCMLHIVHKIKGTTLVDR